jgi:transcriptional regulator with XRE-family HTH domain
MNIGERILQYRANHKKTQKEMAHLLDEKPNMIWKAENNVNLHSVNRVRLELKMDRLELGELK